MRIDPRTPPRTFDAGAGVTLSDCGDLHLGEDEQVTFVTESGRRYDVVRKGWGFYATPSVNGRLKDEGFRTALVRNRQGRVFVMVVEAARQDQFERYCDQDGLTVMDWLDRMRVDG